MKEVQTAKIRFNIFNIWDANQIIKINYERSPSGLQYKTKRQALLGHLIQACSYLEFGQQVEALQIQTWQACLAEDLAIELPEAVVEHGLAD